MYGGRPLASRAGAVPATPACPSRTRPPLRRHPLAGGGMSPHAAPPALLSNPIHENGTFRGLPRSINSSVPKNHPFSGLARHLPQDLPCQEPVSWKVLRFSVGPSMAEPIFLEGPAFFRGTFHARGRFPGRSCLFPGDLPCQSPFSRKVLRFSGGPSMPEPVFPEGPVFFRVTFHARSHFPGRSCVFRGTFHAGGCFPGRSCVFQGDLPCQGPFFWKVLRFSGGPSTPEAIFLEGSGVFSGTFHARSRFPGRSLSKCS